MIRFLKARPCVVCGTQTLDRSGPYNTPRCAVWLPCALRRNAGRSRPRLESEVVAKALARGHPAEARDVLLAMRRDAERKRIRDASLKSPRPRRAAAGEGPRPR
jgi:hypothetical protein